MKTKILSYRDLEVWQLSMELAERVYLLVRTFPQEERFGLCDQLRRAVVSIPSNIAEGKGRDTARDYVHFLCLSRGSLNEVCTQLELAKRLGYVPEGTGLYELTQSIGRKLNQLIVRLRSPVPRQASPDAQPSPRPQKFKT